MICTIYDKTIINFKTMSRQMNNNRNSVKKPYCKVCHDAGKSESDYTSHFVRSLPDRQGNCKVTCPTLLNTECRFCYAFGHTAKFCPNIAAKKKDEDRLQRQEQYRAKEARKPVQQKPNLRGGFAVLNDSDDENEKKPVKKEEYPALGAPSQRVAIVSSYASAAAKPAPVKTQNEASLPVGFKVLEKGDRIEKTKVPNTNFNFRTSNWAEYTDSEDDEDEEERVETAW